MKPRANNPFFRTFDIETGGLRQAWFYHGTPEAALFDKYPQAMQQFLRASQDYQYAYQEFLRTSVGRDFTSTYFYLQHSGYQVYQIYSPEMARYTDPAKTWIRPSPGFQVSSFAKSQGIYGSAIKHGELSETDALLGFYQNLERDIESASQAGQKLTLAAWNPLFDMSALEAATRRLDGLQQYQGFFAKQINANRLQVQPLEEPFLELAQEFGRRNPAFAQKYFRDRLTGLPTTTMRRVKGWSVENLVSTIGRDHFNIAGGLHSATTDVPLEQALFDSMQAALSDVRAGVDFDAAIAKHVPGATTAQDFFAKIYDSPLVDFWESRTQQGEQILNAARLSTMSEAKAASSFVRAGWSRSALYGVGIGIGAAGLYGLAFGGRRRDGLFPEGVADHAPILRSAMAVGAVGAVYGFHRQQLAHNPEYAKKLYGKIKTIEERSPAKLFKTLQLSEYVSSYNTPSFDVLKSTFARGDALTPFGEHLQRVVGPGIDLRKFEKLSFARRDSSPYLDMLVDGAETDVRVRFADRGRMTASSFHLGRELSDAEGPPVWKFGAWRRSQHDRAYYTIKNNEEALFHPVLSVRRGDHFRNLVNKTELVMFSGVERLNQTLSLIGMGLRPGQYNSTFGIRQAVESRQFSHLFEGGYVPQLLFKRVLPVYAGIQTLRFADYLLGHKPSEAAANLVASADIFRAEFTDRLPFARSLTDRENEILPGPAYTPLAFPLLGVSTAALYHYFGDVVPGHDLKGANPFSWVSKLGAFGKPIEKYIAAGQRGPDVAYAARRMMFRSRAAFGALAGSLLALPFLPKMLGSADTASEKRQEYQGDKLIPVRSGRWWEVGTTAWQGDRIKYYRPNWYQRMKARANVKTTYGSEGNYWKYNFPVIGWLNRLRDPYFLERLHEKDRPYPVTSPAFSNIPLIGPVLAATVGKLVKPVRYMHEGEWSADDYTLYSRRLEPRGEEALPPAAAKPEFGLVDTVKRQMEIYMEAVGLPGFLGETAYHKLFGHAEKDDVNLQGSRQLDNASRRYYELELGALMGPEGEGYSEPIRRLIQREDGIAQVNEIPNQMPSWLPGDTDDYFLNFRRGDPYLKVQEGALRLPGPGYEALHPELAGLSPEDYPDIVKFRILADVAPYSGKYTSMKQHMQSAARRDPSVQIEVSEIVERVNSLKESAVNNEQRRFTGETEEIEGRIHAAGVGGIELENRPGQTFRFSSVGLSAADLAAVELGRNNQLSKDALNANVLGRQQELSSYLENTLAPGTSVRLVVPKGAGDESVHAAAVVFAGGKNINRELIQRGLAQGRLDDSGPEAQAMFSAAERLVGSAYEGATFTGDSAWWNPLRYLPSPYHTKFAQRKTALARYLNEEVYGSRARPWERPVEGILAPWFRGAVHRLTGRAVISDTNQEKQDLHELTDKLTYLRSLVSEERTAAMERARTVVGANLFGSAAPVKTALSDRDKKYFDDLLQETDPDKRAKILESVSPELARALAGQWEQARRQLQAAREGQDAEPEESRFVTEEDQKRAKKAGISASDVSRAREIAQFFSTRGIRLPSEDSAVYSPDLDYEDVKAKVLQWEGRDLHDFGIYQDREAMLWRKPYVDGAARELTAGEERDAEQLQRQIEKMMRNSKTRRVSKKSFSDRDKQTVRMKVRVQPDQEIRQDIRHHAEEYAP